MASGRDSSSHLSAHGPHKYFWFAVEELLSIPEWVQPPAVQRSLIVDASHEHINPASKHLYCMFWDHRLENTENLTNTTREVICIW